MSRDPPLYSQPETTMRPPLLALATLLGSLILGAALTGCGRSQGPSLAALPVYLGATQTESMAGSAPGG